jgi:hypothetical protein
MKGWLGNDGRVTRVVPGDRALTGSAHSHAPSSENWIGGSDALYPHDFEGSLRRVD